MAKGNSRRIRIVVTAQTLYHLQQMQQFCGYKDIGRVVDKLVREKQLSHKEAYYGRPSYPPHGEGR